jgi:hypothetical protein
MNDAFNHLKPTGYVMHHQFNIQQLYALPTLYVFCIYLRTNSDLCHLQHKLIGFYNRDEKCLQRGTDWVFKYSGLRFVCKGLKRYIFCIIISCHKWINLRRIKTMHVNLIKQRTLKTHARNKIDFPKFKSEINYILCQRLINKIDIRWVY